MTDSGDVRLDGRSAGDDSDVSVVVTGGDGDPVSLRFTFCRLGVVVSDFDDGDNNDIHVAFALCAAAATLFLRARFVVLVVCGVEFKDMSSSSSMGGLE